MILNRYQAARNFGICFSRYSAFRPISARYRPDIGIFSRYSALHPISARYQFAGWDCSSPNSCSTLSRNLLSRILSSNFIIIMTQQNYSSVGATSLGLVHLLSFSIWGQLTMSSSPFFTPFSPIVASKLSHSKSEMHFLSDSRRP